MKRSIWLILLLCCQSLSSIAADNLLIEQTYKRVSGEPNIYFETFYVKDGCLGSLEIYNGDSAGDHRISSASIQLNEAELLSTKELNQHVGKLVKEVYFSNGDNSIDVEIASRPFVFAVG